MGDMYGRLNNNGDIAFIDSKAFAYDEINSNNYTNIYIGKEMVSLSLSHIVTRKKFKYKNLLNTALIRMVESGMCISVQCYYFKETILTLTLMLMLMMKKFS